MTAAFDLVVLLLLITIAVAVVRSRDLLAAAILFSGYGLTLCLLWLHRGAPDVAMAEAAVGAGVTTVLFLVTIGATRRWER